MREITDFPEEAIEEDLPDELYVRQKIEAGLRAAEEERIISHEEVKRRFILPE